jgi:nucleoside phosphorylase
MILSTGFCGALRGEVHTGDIVVSSSVAYGDMELIQKILDPKGHTGSFEGSGVFDIDVNNEFMTVIRNDFSGIRSMAHIGRTVTCSQAIKNRNEKARIGKYFDALAVDMEDYGRLRMARSLAAQIWCVRAVLDGPEDTIPGPWSGIGPGKLSALLRNIPPAQQSICRMLTTLVPAMFKRMKLK